MPYLGEYMLGEWVSIPVDCKNASGVLANPDAAPTLKIYKSNATQVITSRTMAPLAPGVETGLFNLDLQLNSSFSAGLYKCLIQYAVSSSNKAELHYFRIVAGGNAKGAYVALFYYRRPHANYLVGQLDDGTLEARRGPKL